MLVDDVRALIRAELKYFQSRIDYSRTVLTRAFVFGSAALLAFAGAMISLVTGLVITLAPIIGPGWATLLVTLALVIIGSILGVQARNWVSKVYFPEIESSDDENT